MALRRIQINRNPPIKNQGENRTAHGLLRTTGITREPVAIQFFYDHIIELLIAVKKVYSLHIP